MNIQTCHNCEDEFISDLPDDYKQFCSQRCGMEKYGYTPEDFYPTDYQDREVE